MINKYLLNECSTIGSLFIWENETTVMWKRHSACSVWSQRTDQEVQDSDREALFSSSTCPRIDLLTCEWGLHQQKRGDHWRCRELNVSQLWGWTTPVQSLGKPLTIWEVLGQISKSGCASLCVYNVGMLSLMLRGSYFSISKSGCLSQSLAARWQQWHSCLPMLGILGMSCVQL